MLAALVRIDGLVEGHVGRLVAGDRVTRHVGSQRRFRASGRFVQAAPAVVGGLELRALEAARRVGDRAAPLRPFGRSALRMTARILYAYTAVTASARGSGPGARAPGNSRGPDSGNEQRRAAADTTAGTVPNHAAVTPDSNSPSSFEAPMNTALTALTRPRISSGVSSCTSRWRM